MRLIVPAIALMALAAACGSGNGDGEGEQMARETAVRAVNEWMHPDGDAPEEPVGRDFECTIRGGGPAPGITVDGTCRWDAERQDGSWQVSFKQTWKCEDFSGMAEGYEPCTGEFGSHTWRHLVYEDGGIEFAGSEGQMPPSAAQ
jgi:hypothetical protein